MRLVEVTRLSIEALLGQKFRSALTMLGMIIGVFAVVVLVALGQGAKNYVLSEFQSLGANFIVVQPGKTDKKSSFGPPVGTAQRKMDLADVVALERKALNLDAVSGLILGTAEIKVDQAIANVNIFGVNDQFPKIVAMKVSEGDFFTRDEDDYGRRVVVLGANVAKDLFPTEYPIGRNVKLNQSPFRVIGVLQSMGSKLGFNIDEFALIPTTAALKLFNDDKLFGIRAKASSRASVDDAVQEVKDILKERRDGEEDFTIITQIAMMESMGSILGMLSYVLGAIAMVSMLVGGIGIMNIMLVSVTERISEIGIRRAVGARKIDILKQFLAEAFMLSTISACVGVSAALFLTYGSYFFYPSFDMRPPWWIVWSAFMLSLFVGIIFGVWPAKKAASIETLDALRHE